MLRILEITDEHARSSERIVPNSWIHAVGPSDTELAQLRDTGIPSELLSHVLDDNERTRVVRRGDNVLVVVHLPYQQDNQAKIPYATAPVSLILLPQYIVTIEPRNMGLFEKLSANPPSGLDDIDKTHFVLGVILQAASDYLANLRDINLAVDEVESRLQRSLRNQEVLQLLKFQKSLVYFSTALNSIEMMVEKLRKGDFLVWASEGQEPAEDALIEIRQAVYQVEIAQNILTQMMDAFASIVSNNLNTVMKFLAAITIVISVPMLIASVYGMNVPLPGGMEPQAFGYLIVGSALLSVFVIIVFRLRDWL